MKSRAPAESPSADSPELAAESAVEETIERLTALAELPPRSTTVALPSGRAVTVESGAGERLYVRGPAGEVELSIRFTAQGPVLNFSAAAIDLKSEGAIRMECERLDVHARSEVAVTSDGGLRETVAGARVSEVGGKSSLVAHAVEIASRRGDVAVKANDDVRIDGERVLLNS